MTARSRTGLVLALTLIVLAANSAVDAQQKPAIGPEDYARWERLGSTQLSPDGRWLVAAVTRVDGTFELRLREVGAAVSDQPSSVPDAVVLESGSAAAFSADSSWLAYRIGYSEVEREAMQKRDEPIQYKVGLVSLADPATGPEVVDKVVAFRFSGDGDYLAMQRYAAQGSETGSADVLVRDLATGVDISFGNVRVFTWADEGSLLAMAIAAEDQAGNGVHLYDPTSGRLVVLDSGEADFSGLSWREDADDLALLRSREDEAYEGPTHLVLTWRGLRAQLDGGAGAGAGGELQRDTYDHREDPSFPEEMRVHDSPAPTWADDGSAVFFGIREWEKKPEEEIEEEAEGAEPAERAGEEEREERGGGEAEGEEGQEEEGEPAEEEMEPELEPADVDVWHYRDERIIPMQRLQKQRDLRRSYLSVWHIDEARFVRLGTDLMERVTPLEGQEHAVETDRSPYIFDNMFDRTRNDIYLIDVGTGEREKVIEGTQYFYGGSATGRYLLYFADDHFWTYDITAGARTNITADIPSSFVNDEYDTPVRQQKPPFGFAGWEKSDEGLLLYDKYDMWGVHPNGSRPINWSRGIGADQEIRHRWARVDREQDFIDIEQPFYISLYGRWTKQYGFARMRPGAPPERLVFSDKNIGRLMRAEDADVYAFLVQGFDDSPDYFVGGPDLSDARQMTETNPFQADYAWGRSELIDYQNSRGQRLQGALFYPANYEEGRQYPMIVYVYEQLAQMVHSYAIPSERSPYNASVFTAEGYFVLEPDIVYVDRDPGPSAVDCVTAAVEKVLESGVVDRDRIGLVGHSWGGYEATFIPTQTDLFATSIAGAAITNMFSFFGAIHWNIGMPEPQHFETGQARMEVPHWQDMEAYARNSSTAFVHQLNTPMLLYFGDNDGTVDFRQGVEMYNYARRAGKFLVMLVYADEGHSNRQKKNQVDYHRRILEWFGHFLKGEEAPRWISEGVTVIDRDKELEHLKR